MTYVLIGPDGQPYPSQTPGALGGHRKQRIYGRLNCPSALHAIASGRGTYEMQRVFFADETTAVAAGYRPCARCMPEDYARWKATPQPRMPGLVARVRYLKGDGKLRHATIKDLELTI